MSFASRTTGGGSLEDARRVDAVACAGCERSGSPPTGAAGWGAEVAAAVSPVVGDVTAGAGGAAAASDDDVAVEDGVPGEDAAAGADADAGDAASVGAEARACAGSEPGVVWGACVGPATGAAGAPGEAAVSDAAGVADETDAAIDATGAGGVSDGGPLVARRLELCPLRLLLADRDVGAVSLTDSARCFSRLSKNGSRGWDGASACSLSTSTRADLKSSAVKAASVCAIRLTTSWEYCGTWTTGGAAGCAGGVLEPKILKPARMTTRTTAAPPPTFARRRRLSSSSAGESKLERAARAMAAASEKESAVKPLGRCGGSRGGSIGLIRAGVGRT